MEQARRNEAGFISHDSCAMTMRRPTMSWTWSYASEKLWDLASLAASSWATLASTVEMGVPSKKSVDASIIRSWNSSWMSTGLPGVMRAMMPRMNGSIRPSDATWARSNAGRSSVRESDQAAPSCTKMPCLPSSGRKCGRPLRAKSAGVSGGFFHETVMKAE